MVETGTDLAKSADSVYVSNKSNRKCLGFLVGLAVLIPCFAKSQTTFVYLPSDPNTQVAEGPTVLNFAMRTVITIQGNSNPTPEFLGPTKALNVLLKPPTSSARVMRATFEGKVIALTIRRSTIDGEMEGTVELPLRASDGSDVKVDWVADEGTGYQTSTQATLSK